MEYIVPAEKGFNFTEDADGAVLELVRSDQGDGGWSLHAIGDEEILNSGEAEWILGGGGFNGQWNRPNKEDINRALSLLFVRKVAEMDGYDDYAAAHLRDVIEEARKLCGMDAQ